MIELIRHMSLLSKLATVCFAVFTVSALLSHEWLTGMLGALLTLYNIIMSVYEMQIDELLGYINELTDERKQW